jgi:hypothetical protein
MTNDGKISTNQTGQKNLRRKTLKITNAGLYKRLLGKTKIKIDQWVEYIEGKFT